MPQLLFPHCARHNIAAAGEVDAPQRSASEEEANVNMSDTAER